jgi:hypothetical protein
MLSERSALSERSETAAVPGLTRRADEIGARRGGKAPPEVASRSERDGGAAAVPGLTRRADEVGARRGGKAAPEATERSERRDTVFKTAALAGAVRRASDHAPGKLGSERLLPVLPELRELLPGRGLRRGATVAIATTTGPETARPVRSTGATSLLFALLAAASGAGSWCAVVGVPALGVVAAAEAGIALDRLALVPNPGPDWTTVVAALLDGVDIVVAAPPGPIAPSVAARLAARARQRGSVLMSYGQWDGADITFDAVRGVWHGLEQGRGRLRCRQVTVVARGRGAAAAPKRTEIWWPSPRSWTVTPAIAGPGVQDLEEPIARAG